MYKNILEFTFLTGEINTNGMTNEDMHIYIYVYITKQMNRLLR